MRIGEADWYGQKPGSSGSRRVMDSVFRKQNSFMRFGWEREASHRFTITEGQQVEVSNFIFVKPKKDGHFEMQLCCGQTKKWTKCLERMEATHQNCGKAAHS